VSNAERGVIGAAMDGTAGHPAILALGDADFEDRRLAAVAAVMRDMIRAGDPIDPVTLHAEITRRNLLVKAPSIVELFELMTQAPPAVMAWSYARIVRSDYRKRRLAGLTQMMARTLDDGDPTFATDDIDLLLNRMRADIDAVPGDLVENQEDLTVAMLLDEPDRPEEWIVPGLLAHGERVVISGHEGRGKSVLLRQLAVCLAAGVHPWTARTGRQRPHRVLQIDAENSRDQTRRGYRLVERIAGGLPEGWAERITLHSKPAGLDLPGRDIGWLHEVCAKVSPDVIIVGPAYKLMMGGDPQNELAVMGLLSALDEVRVRHQAAVIVEHHSPFGDEKFGPRTVRPYGSSYWLRWPEVGIGLRNHDDPAEAEARAEFENRTGRVPRIDHMDLVQWRPAREDRDWPSEIRYGPITTMPWVPADGYTPSVAYSPAGRPATQD